MRINIRGKQLRLRAEMRGEVERKIYFALGRFADMVRKVEVTLADANGPRGGVDQCGRIVVQLQQKPTVVAEVVDSKVLSALDRSCHRIKRLVGRAVESFGDREASRFVSTNGLR